MANRFLRLGLILALALVIRGTFLALVLLVRGVSGLHDYDTRSYVEPATELVATGRFAVNGAPEIRRTPGYPLLLAIGLLLGHVEIVTAVVQVILSCLTVWLVHRIALHLTGDERAAGFAALVYACEPLSVFYSVTLMSEALFAFVVSGSVYLLVRYLENPRALTIVAAAALLAASGYVRPIAYPLPLVLACVIGPILLVRRSSTTRLVLHVVSFLVVSYGLMGLWQARNFAVARYPLLSSISDFNLYWYEAAAVQSVNEGVSADSIRHRIESDEQRWHMEHASADPTQARTERPIEWRRRGILILEGSPWLYARLRLTGTARVVVNPGATEYLAAFGREADRTADALSHIIERGIVTTALTIVREDRTFVLTSTALGLFLFMAYGLTAVALLSRTIRPAPFFLIAVVMVYLVLASGGGVGASRLRHPVMPLVAVLAGSGASYLLDRSHGSRTRAGGDRTPEE